jgi:hypothetical protein
MSIELYTGTTIFRNVIISYIITTYSVEDTVIVRKRKYSYTVLIAEKATLILSLEIFQTIMKYLLNFSNRLGTLPQ